MAKLARRRWVSEVTSGAPRRDRASCEYEAYVPDRLSERPIRLDGIVAADVADAERAIARLDAQAVALIDTEALARLLLRAEAVASSRIEGLEIGPRRLLHAEAARGSGERVQDVTAAEVLGNIDAMVYALEAVRHGEPITVDLILEVHRRLLAGSSLHSHAGRIREEQNWIGGSSYNPCSAAFVPPPPELVHELMDDLCSFCNNDDLPAVAQAAVAHAQFETIHPFADGNGRTGRALIQVLLRRRGLAKRVLPPVSLILATWARSYVGGLTAFRYVGPSNAAAAYAGLNEWVGLFATSCTRAVEDALAFEARANALESQWRERLGRVRANSATDLLLRALPGAPVLTVDSAAALIGRTFKPANEAIDRLVASGVLKQITVGKRNRAFEAPDVITAFTDLERQLASPEGNTKASRPVRAVPSRRRV